MGKYSENTSDPKLVGDIQAALSAGMAIGDPRVVAVAPTAEAVYAVVPEGARLESLERFFSSPARIRQRLELHDTESFIAYVKAFGSQAGSRIFFNAADSTEGDSSEAFIAVLDYHEKAGEIEFAAWCDHVATYNCRRSVEFETWMGSNRRQMNQTEFARFLEENLPDVIEPSGATLLEVATNLQAHKEVTFSSGVRLSNGQIQFQYDEVVRGATSKGTVEIPEQFTLGIPIHERGPAYRIPVRLRWRLQEGKASFFYDLVRPHKFVEAAVAEIRSKIAADTGIAVLSGVTG